MIWATGADVKSPYIAICLRQNISNAHTVIVLPRTVNPYSTVICGNIQGSQLLKAKSLNLWTQFLNTFYWNGCGVQIYWW